VTKKRFHIASHGVLYFVMIKRDVSIFDFTIDALQGTQRDIHYELRFGFPIPPNLQNNTQNQLLNSKHFS
jgi:hypothetical protein